jgi:hypothetical protein
MATWEVDGIEGSRTGTARPEADANRLEQIAGQVKPLDAQVIVLRGLRDRQIADRLASLLQPAGYHLTHHSTLSTGVAGSASSITLLAKWPAFVARSVEWRTTGQLDSPGGFVFAGFSSGGQALCVYVAQLPEGAATTRNMSTSRCRELAAQYLAYHANWLGGVLSNQVASFYLGGNFGSDSETARHDPAVKALELADFKSIPPPTSGIKRTASPSSGLTVMLARNADFSSAPRILPQDSFERPVVVYNFLPTAPGSSDPAATPAPGPTIETSVPARLLEGIPNIAWLWAGGAAAGLTVIVVIVRLVRRATPSSGVFGTRDGAPAVLDSDRYSDDVGRRDALGEPEEYDSGSSSDDGSHSDAAVWQARALQAEERASRANAVVRSGLMPRLNRLMRERLIAWLTSQRSQLLTSHEVGTQQVMELEERLQRLQGQFHETLQTREQRIGELEQEILEKERVIRDLLRAQVRVADESTSP